MAFETGNSGNKLFDAVVKLGNEVQQEGAFCQLLGEDVCPKIYSLIPNGYVMERLAPAPRTPDLLVNIENLLEERVWSRPALPSSSEWDWKDSLLKYGIDTPDWVESKETCMVHGDPTASNALVRGRDLVMCDPRPPRAYIPQSRYTDMGRILQSLSGWEHAAYNQAPVSFDRPRFTSNPEVLKQAMFWLKAAAARIECLERSRSNRENILNWCWFVKRAYYV